MLQLGCPSAGIFDHRPLRMSDVILVSGCRIHITLAGLLASQIQLANRGWLSSAISRQSRLALAAAIVEAKMRMPFWICSKDKLA